LHQISQNGKRSFRVRVASGISSEWLRISDKPSKYPNRLLQPSAEKTLTPSLSGVDSQNSERSCQTSTQLDTLRIIKRIAGLERQQNFMLANKQFNILKFDDLVKIKIEHFVQRHYNNKLPPIFSIYFTRLNQYHSVNTRNWATVCNYVIPGYKTNKLQRFIKYHGLVT